MIRRLVTVFSLNVRMLSIVPVVFVAQESLWHALPVLSYHTTIKTTHHTVNNI